MFALQDAPHLGVVLLAAAVVGVVLLAAVVVGVESWAQPHASRDVPRLEGVPLSEGRIPPLLPSRLVPLPLLVG